MSSQTNTTTTATKQLEAWFKDRPAWMEDAACRLILNSTLTNEDYESLVSLCIAEGKNEKVSHCEIPPGSLDTSDSTTALRLDAIAAVKGVNALTPRQPLSFSDKPLCIIYGRNGSGKSGYVRLLKHTCGSRNAGKLLGNVFSSETLPQSASISFTQDGEKKTEPWTGTPLTSLLAVDIFDTNCGLIYINDENEATFEPWLLRIYTKLTSACEEVGSRIQARITYFTTWTPEAQARSVQAPAISRDVSTASSKIDPKPKSTNSSRTQLIPNVAH